MSSTVDDETLCYRGRLLAEKSPISQQRAHRRRGPLRSFELRDNERNPPARIQPGKHRAARRQKAVLQQDRPWPSSPKPIKDYINNVKQIQNLAEIQGMHYAPIDLNLYETEAIQLSPLQWFNYNIAPKKMKITNTAFTVILSAKWMQERPYITSGPLIGKHVFSQLHFHWSEANEEGSEHTADGENFPLEMHIVHFNSAYGTQEAALTQKDGISVIIYFFKIQNEDNPNIQDLIDTLPYVEIPHTSVHLELRPISELFRPFKSDYFLYWGSVMTSTCSHTILWFISREPIGISVQQIEKFRQLRGIDNKPLRNNFRQVQPLSGRTLFHVSPSNLSDSVILQIPATPGHEIMKTDQRYSKLAKRKTSKDAVKLKPTPLNENFEKPQIPLKKLAVSFSDIVNVPSTEYPCSASLNISDDEDTPDGTREDVTNISNNYGIMVAAYAHTNTFEKTSQVLNQNVLTLAPTNKEIQNPSLHLSNTEHQVNGVNVAIQVSDKDMLLFGDRKNKCSTPRNEDKIIMEKTPNIKRDWPPQPTNQDQSYQSPININADDVPIAIFAPLMYENYWAEPVPLLMANNGHTVEIVVHENHPHSTIKGGLLSGDYELSQLHFHWGPRDDLGSEHTVNGERAAMEVHMVYYNKQLGSLDRAAIKSNGIAVIAFLLKADDKENRLFQKLCCHLTKIEHPFTSTEIDSDSLLWLKDHEKMTGFYTFPGSLTMPVFSQSVIWIMYPDPINVSHKQVDEFRRLQEGYHYITHNLRELQPFNNRPIYFCP